MDTHGHEEIAKKAGYPVLKSNFEPRMDNPRLSAFYLGNWLTDLSQVIDPKPEQKAEDIENFLSKAESYFLEIADGFFSWLFDQQLYSVGAEIFRVRYHFNPDVELQKIRDEYAKIVKAIVQILFKKDAEGRSSYFRLIQPGVLLKGYFKFVHPEKIGDPPRMDLKAFLHVFDHMFTKYHAHEHLDRPHIVEKSNDDRKHYDDRLSDGPRNATSTDGPDLYTYLREDIQVIAGLLMDLDRNWASNLGRQNQSPIEWNDANLDWNLGLARLGHALHGVEDFFAHSNFTEIAALVMGEEKLPRSYQNYNLKFQKRLKKYNNNDPEDQTEWEQFIVTGYFDTKDTIFSIAHMALDGLLGIFNLEARDITEDLRVFANSAKNPEIAVNSLVKTTNQYFSDFLEILEDPEKILTADENVVVEALKDLLKDNIFTGDLLDRLGQLVDAIVHPTPEREVLTLLVDHMPFFEGIKNNRHFDFESAEMARIFDAFFQFIQNLRIVVKTAFYEHSMYKVIQDISELILTPWKWINDKLIESVNSHIVKYLISVDIYLSKELLYEYFDANRIGSHTLLSKDHKAQEEILYDSTFALASTVHYVVVNTMLRWSEINPDTVPENQMWVNWLELLEFFLSNPLAGATNPQDVELLLSQLYIPTPEDNQIEFDKLLLKLFELSTYVEFSLFKKDFFRLNLDQVRKRGKTKTFTDDLFKDLEAVGSLSIIGLPRRLLIPKVKQNAPLFQVYESKWYMEVMDNGWESIKTRNPHDLTFYKTDLDARKDFEEFNNLRLRLEARS